MGEDGKPIKFDPTRVEDMVAMIPPPARSEIANFIRGESDLDEGEG